MTPSFPIRILFVCLGNICRSPMAEGIVRHAALEAGLLEGEEAHFLLDSAGTGHWHIGSAPDERGVEALSTLGIDISTQCARQIAQQDFSAFDRIYAMDRDNLQNLRAICPKEFQDRLALFLLLSGKNADVPDPYYGGQEGFLDCINLIQEAAKALVDDIKYSSVITD